MCAAFPATRILLVPGIGSISPAVARAAGASGFVSKGWVAADVVRGGAYGHSRPGGVRVGTASGAGGAIEREREVAKLIASAATNAEIARCLHLSPHTVKEHTNLIYRKLAVRNRAEAVRRPSA